MAASKILAAAILIAAMIAAVIGVVWLWWLQPFVMTLAFLFCCGLLAIIWSVLALLWD